MFGRLPLLILDLEKVKFFSDFNDELLGGVSKLKGLISFYFGFMHL